MGDKGWTYGSSIKCLALAIWWENERVKEVQNNSNVRLLYSTFTSIDIFERFYHQSVFGSPEIAKTDFTSLKFIDFFGKTHTFKKNIETG